MMTEPVNHLLLIACICVIIALVLYFFYWNRFVAWVISVVIRLLWWDKGGGSSWVEIGTRFARPCFVFPLGFPLSVHR
jgi:hypothetical protein